MPSSDSSANARASPVSPRCVPPQNSTLNRRLSGRGRVRQQRLHGLADGHHAHRVRVRLAKHRAQACAGRQMLTI